MPEPLQLFVGGVIPVQIEEEDGSTVNEVKLVELLGGGGFGFAYKAEDTATGALYVFKIIQGIKPGSVMVERIKLEASVRLPSKHIVPAVGLREYDPSTFFILFEYFPGKSLDILLEEKILTNDQKRKILVEAMIGIADAHDNNIIHRDIKPGNILVEDSGNTRLIDFGISKFKGKNLTITGELMGTYPYMAPEIFMSVKPGVDPSAKHVDARADIFSIGQVFYELAMDLNFWTKMGWYQNSAEDLFRWITNTKPTPTEIMDLTGFHCEFQLNAGEMIKKMTKLDPEQRYFSMADVLNELGEKRGGGPPPLPAGMFKNPIIIVESGSNKNARTILPLNDCDCRVLGREDIAGSDTSISRQSSGGHIKICRRGSQYFVTQLTEHETMIRGLTLTKGEEVEIKHTDRIKIGAIYLRFILQP